MENKVDHYEDELGTYLVRLSRYELSQKDSQQISILLHSIGDFERISDHAVNLMESAREMKQKGMNFSESAAKEIHVFTEALRDIVERTVTVFQTGDLALAKSVEPLEDTIDTLNNEIKTHHIERLKNGRCTIELGFVLSDISTNYERIADHCSNIAVCQIQLPKNEYDAHEYMIQLKKKENSEFFTQEESFLKKYHLPEK